jgi:putative alpha-1,2-mannosidase
VSQIQVRPQSDRHSTGTKNGGNDFPGVARPFGMVKLGPDLLSNCTDSYSGHLPNGNFSAFSMMHEQGTGGAPKYGTVPQLPLIGNITNPLSSITVGRAVPDQGSVGYYKAQTTDNVIVELAAGSRAGMYQYTFPKSNIGNNVLIDMSHVLPSFRGQGLSQGYAGGNFTIMRDGHYEASGVYNNGWNRSPNWTIYSCTFIVLKFRLQLLTRSRRLLQCYAFSSSCVHRCRKWKK